MHWYYRREYDYGAGIPGLPTEVHGFVLNKPTAIRDALVACGAVAQAAFVAPESIVDADLLRVHNAALLAALGDPVAVAAAIELYELAALPADLVRSAVVAPQLRACGGTLAALRHAAQGGWAVNLSGGYHHARRDLSHGFCLVNDVAVGLARLRHEGVHRRVLIVDLDLHQGDGNATMFAGDHDVFTLSVHEEGIFPIPKAKSDLDIGLPGGTGDDEYLAAVDEALAFARQRFEPEIVVYVAGTDPYVADPLGSLRISEAGLCARDRRVAEFARENGAALVALPAGGYTPESSRLSAAGFAAMLEIQRKTGPADRRTVTKRSNGME